MATTPKKSTIGKIEKALKPAEEKPVEAKAKEPTAKELVESQAALIQGLEKTLDKEREILKGLLADMNKAANAAIVPLHELHKAMRALPKLVRGTTVQKSNKLKS